MYKSDDKIEYWTGRYPLKWNFEEPYEYDDRGFLHIKVRILIVQQGHIMGRVLIVIVASLTFPLPASDDFNLASTRFLWVIRSLESTFFYRNLSGFESTRIYLFLCTLPSREGLVRAE